MEATISDAVDHNREGVLSERERWSEARVLLWRCDWVIRGRRAKRLWSLYVGLAVNVLSACKLVSLRSGPVGPLG